MFYSAGHILRVSKIMLSCWNQWRDKTPNICYANSWPITGFNSSGPLQSTGQHINTSVVIVHKQEQQLVYILNPLPDELFFVEVTFSLYMN